MRLRIRALLIHLVFSVALAIFSIVIVFCVWYPAPLYKAVGVIHIFLLLLLVDMLLGPLLTFIVFKVGKKTLVFDLTVIGILQFSALAYGLWTVFEGRPAWLVFNADRFDLVRVLDIDTRRLEQAAIEYRFPSWAGPRWVAAIPPVDMAARNQMLFESIQGGSDLPQRPDLYQPLANQSTAIKRRMLPLRELGKFNPPAQLRSALHEWPQANAWLPLMANASPMVVLLNSNGGVVSVVDLRPW